MWHEKVYIMCKIIMMVTIPVEAAISLTPALKAVHDQWIMEMRAWKHSVVTALENFGLRIVTGLRVWRSCLRCPRIPVPELTP